MKHFFVISITMAFALMLIATSTIPSNVSASTEHIYFEKGGANTVWYQAVDRTASTASVTTLNTGIIGIGYNTGPAQDISRSLIEVDLSDLPDDAIVKKVALYIYCYDNADADNVYFTKSDMTGTPTSAGYALSHYGSLIYEHNFAYSDINKYSNITLYSGDGSDYFTAGDIVFIGCLMKLDYNNGGKPAWNFFNCRGPSNGDHPVKLYVEYTTEDKWNPTITSTPNNFINATETFTYAPTANETVVWHLEVYPNGTTFTDGVISFQSNLTGIYDFELWCNNPHNGFAWQNFTLVVNPQWLGGEYITDGFLGFLFIILFTTVLNIVGLKMGIGLLQIFSAISLLVAVPVMGYLEGNEAILICAGLAQVALIIKGMTD